MYRKTYLEINTDNLFYNVELFASKTGKKLMAVVKANAYGTIDYEIAKLLEEKGTDFFAVSSLEEAVRLRNHGIKSNILIMGYVKELDVVKEFDFSIITPDKEFVDANKDRLKGIKVHIKINTGLNRLGIFPEETKEVLNELVNAGANVEGIMTHYACYADVDYTYRQYYLFKETVESLDYQFKYIHAAATDAALYLEDEISNYQRIGLGLFGYANIEHDWNLKSALSLKAEVVSCKKVKEGEGVSYGHHYISDGSGYILTAEIGYADGIDKGLENKKVYVGDEECTIVGTICMDLIMIKSNKPHKVGEMVEIFGDHFTVENRKNELNSGCCKIIAGISERVTRVYTKDNKVISEISLIK